MKVLEAHAGSGGQGVSGKSDMLSIQNKTWPIMGKKFYEVSVQCHRDHLPVLSARYGHTTHGAVSLCPSCVQQENPPALIHFSGKEMALSEPITQARVAE